MTISRQKVANTDISIEIRVDNIFNLEGAFIISTNTTFDTDMSNSLISKHSLQGQFTRKYYDNTEYLDHDLKRELENQEFTLVNEKKKGKKKRYAVGTVAKVCPKNQLVYLVAIAHMNEEGKAYSSFKEVIESLGKLWYYIAEQSELEPLVVPVLGTRLARLDAKVTREDMIREIIKSFIAACSEKKFCEKMTIVIFENDYREHEIDLQELEAYLRYNCLYTDIKDKEDTGRGEAIS